MNTRFKSVLVALIALQLAWGQLAKAKCLSIGAECQPASTSVLTNQPCCAGATCLPSAARFAKRGSSRSARFTCQECLNCADGEYETQDCTAFTDRKCAKCPTSCTLGAVLDPGQCGGKFDGCVVQKACQTLALADYSTCAILDSDSSVQCFGANWYDQLEVPAVSEGYRSLSCGYYLCCGVTNSGELKCWGGAFDREKKIPRLPSGTTWASVAVGAWFHVCGLTSDARILCWGNTDYGGTAVPTINGNWRAVSSGATFSCGLKSDGSIQCWDGNSGATDDLNLVPKLNSGEIYTKISAGHFHVCAITSFGRLLCWGDNHHGQTDVPALGGDATYIAVSSSLFFTCGLTDQGHIKCWGLNNAGQCDVPNISGRFLAVQVGEENSCALSSDKKLICWGDNTFKQSSPPIAYDGKWKLC